ncbi:MAG: 50S ribosomal protein L21 [Anaerolineae bacterium]
MYALIETGGRQYRVAVGDTIDVELLDAQVGDSLDIEKVLLVSDDEAVRVGQPLIEGARVSATVLEHGKGPKVVAFKYRPKERYRRTLGHRQPYTRLRIDDIVAA